MVEDEANEFEPKQEDIKNNSVGEMNLKHGKQQDHNTKITKHVG